MSAQDFVVQLVSEFVDALAPLGEALESVEGCEALLNEFGWELKAGATIEQVQKIFDGLPSVATELKPLAGKLLAALKNQEPPDPEDFKALVKLVKQSVEVVNKVKSNPHATLEPFNKQVFQDTFPKELLQYLVYIYLQERTPRLFAVLALLGIVNERDPDPARLPYTPRRVDWELIPTLVGSPEEAFRLAYDWGEAAFAESQQRLLDKLATVASAYLPSAALLPPSPAELAPYYAPANPHRKRVLTLQATFYQGIQRDGTITMGRLALAALAIPPLSDKQAAPAGLAIYPLVEGKLQLAALKLSDTTTLKLQGGFAAAGGVRVEVYPSKAHVSAGLTGALEAEMRLDTAPPAPLVLLGTRESTRLQIGKAHVSLQARGVIPEIEAVVEAGADAAALILDFRESDGFLRRIFGEKPQTIDLSSFIRWSSRAGLAVGGHPALEVNLPLHQTIAEVIQLQNLLLRVQAATGANSITLQLAVSGSVRMGPIAASVDRVGVEARLSFPPAGGNLGPADLEFAFKPPNGLGLVVDASVVVGGGYLFFDHANRQYAGVIQLEVKKKLALKAIGLLTTRMPDGSAGFSLLIIITAEFPPIQLGYGFTLNGVGGLLGINRTMVLDVLRTGVKTGSLNSVLFPQDPVANAPKILSDLRRVFPPAEGRYVFGPMAKLGWGASIVTVALGIVLELPSPVRLAIMGRIALLLPPGENQGLVKLQMDILGSIDFDKGDAAVDATLYDSKVARFALTGDMALRLNWGDRPTFVMAAGGFNPRFTPPPAFPNLERLAITLSAGDNPRLRLESYLALTANTLQFGARLDIYARAGIFSAAAYLTFDALVNFVPFHFVVDLSGGGCIKRGSKMLFAVDLRLTLAGPTPWHAYGKASFSFFGRHSVEIDYTTGDEQPQLPPPVGDPLKHLCEALVDQRSWSAHLPDGGSGLVSLRQIPVEQRVVMHPFGDLTVRQRVVPLNLDIALYGGVPLPRPARFVVARVSFGEPQDAAKQRQADWEPIRDAFAPAQFQQMSDDQKLSSPAFQSLEAGCTRIRPRGIPMDYYGRSPGESLVSATPTYDEVTVDGKEIHEPARSSGSYKLQGDVLVAAASSGAAGRSAMRRSGPDAFAAGPFGRPAPRVRLSEPRYAVASVGDLSAAPVEGDKLQLWESEAEARAERRARGRAGLQVVGSHEVQ